MKTSKLFSVTSIVLVIFSFIFSSCEKEESSHYLPQIVEYYKYNYSSIDTIGAITEDSVVTINDAKKVYEIHYLQKGCRFIKLISGFPEEFIGEEMLNKKMVSWLYDHKDPKIYSSTFIRTSEWENWFKRNKEEGFSYPIKKMGIFLLPIKTGINGRFIYSTEALVAWAGSTPITYYEETLYDGLPEQKISLEELRRGDIYCPVPIFNFTWYHGEKK